MRILERYVIRLFLLVLIAAMVSIVAIFTVIDLTEHMEDFIEASAPLIAPILYYLYYIPAIFVLTLPVGMLLASLTAIGSLVRNNELLALKASGTSTFRPIRSLAVLSIFVVGVSFAVSESLVPVANEAKGMIWNEYVRKEGHISINETINRTLDLGSGKILFVRSFNTEENEGQNVTLWETSGIETLRQLQARSMQYLEERGSWRFDAATERKWYDGREEYREYDSLEEDLPELTPVELSAPREEPEEMAYSELIQYVRRSRIRGRDITRALVDLQWKIALPFANIIIVLFGAALAAVRRRTGLAVGFTASVFVCFVYYFVMEMGRAFGYNGDLPPLLAAWLGNLIFGALSLYFLWRARF